MARSRGPAGGFGAGDFVGFVPLGVQPDGIGRSPDGRWLYVTSAGPAPSKGTLSVLDLRRAEVNPATSVVSVAAAGCSPARVITAGSVVWVTARDSDTLIAFSAPRLRTSPGRAILAEVPVGSSPIGEEFIDGGARIVVADTNLAAADNASGGLAVVAVARALARRPALLGLVPANGEPRQLAVTGGGATLLMANQVSGLLQAVPVKDLP